MKSGLYALDSCSATAKEAAWANWLLEPTTKDSKLYFGLNWDAVSRARREARRWAGSSGTTAPGVVSLSGRSRTTSTLVNMRSSSAERNKPR